jgi:hypothetical protein
MIDFFPSLFFVIKAWTVTPNENIEILAQNKWEWKQWKLNWNTMTARKQMSRDLTKQANHMDIQRAG